MKILQDLKELDKLTYEFQKINRKRTIYRRRLIKYIRENIENYSTDFHDYDKLKKRLEMNYTVDYKDDELILIVKKILGPDIAIELIKKIQNL
jgi:hypothetical protein